MPDIFTQLVSTPQGSPVELKPTCPPRFVDIARSLQGDGTCTNIDLPLMLATLSMRTTMATMMSTCLWQDTMMGTIYVDTMTASISLVSLGPTHMAGTTPQPPWRTSQNESQKASCGHSLLHLMPSVLMPCFPNNGSCPPWSSVKSSF